MIRGHCQGAGLARPTPQFRIVSTLTQICPATSFWRNSMSSRRFLR